MSIPEDERLEAFDRDDALDSGGAVTFGDGAVVVGEEMPDGAWNVPASDLPTQAVPAQGRPETAPPTTGAVKKSTQQRALQRAAARAGRICLCGCGRAITAQRSTRRFFSTACRVKFHRNNGGTRKKQGLLLGQILILQALAKARGPMTRADICENASVGQGHLSALIGHRDPVKRIAFEAKTGVISLLSLGYVSEHVLRDGGRLERTYKITASGRQW